MSTAREGGGSWSRAVVGGVAGGVAGVVVLWPWLATTGSLLTRDLVAVAGAPGWGSHLMRGGLRLARDVPGEVLAAGLGQVVGGAWVVRLSLLGATVALGAGVGRLLGPASWMAAVVAASAAVVNPWTWAHLQQGQWLVVVACAAVPWIALATARDDGLGTARAVVAAATTGFLAVVVAWPTLVVTALLGRRWRVLGIGGATAVVAALPWLLLPGPGAVDPAGFVAFSANADTPLGVAVSLLSGGGFFNAAVASPWRDLVPIAVLATVVALGALARGVRHATGTTGDPATRTAVAGLAVAGVVGWLVAVVGATTWGLGALARAAAVVPAVAVVRDTHRLLAPLVVVAAVGLGLVVDDVAARLAPMSRATRVGLAAVGLGMLVVMLPDPVLGPRIPGASTLPGTWREAAVAIDESSHPGAVLIVPMAQVQQYPFTPGPVAVPWRRLVDRPVVVGSELVVDDLVIAEGADDSGWAEAAATPPDRWTADRFGDLGIGWVVVTDPDAMDVAELAPGLDVAVADDSLVVVRVDASSIVDLVDVSPSAGVGTWILWVDGAIAVVALALFLPWRRLSNIGHR